MEVVKMARQIIALYEYNKELEAQLQEAMKYKKLYDELLNDNIRHSEKMSANMVKLLMVPGVASALENNPKAFQTETDKPTEVKCG